MVDKNKDGVEDKTIAENLAKSLGDWTKVLEVGSPLLFQILGLATQGVLWARGRGVDTGPLDLLIAEIRTLTAGGLADDAAYRERHPGTL